MSQKKTTETTEKKMNPVMEYLAQFRGTLIINDPALML